MTKDELAAKIMNLPDYVVNKLFGIVETYDMEKDSAENTVFEICPRCGTAHPVIIRAGKSRSGKQLYRCKSCGHRFVEDIGEMTYRSHLSPEHWNEMVKLNLDGASLIETAKALGVSEYTAFRLRHKLMHALEAEEETIVVSEMAELDEKYVMKNHKGLKIKGISGKKRGEPASKRGISDEKVCILTAVQRGGTSYLRSFNMASPSTEALMNLVPHIRKNTYLWTDGLSSYEALANSLGSTRVVLKDRTKYDKVNHLNTVNSFHARIEHWYSTMRGVASKYINRYAALFNMRWNTRAMDTSEALLHVRARLGNAVPDYISSSAMGHSDIFAPSNLVWIA